MESTKLTLSSPGQKISTRTKQPSFKKKAAENDSMERKADKRRDRTRKATPLRPQEPMTPVSGPQSAQVQRNMARGSHMPVRRRNSTITKTPTPIPNKDQSAPPTPTPTPKKNSTAQPEVAAHPSPRFQPLRAKVPPTTQHPLLCTDPTRRIMCCTEVVAKAASGRLKKGDEPMVVQFLREVAGRKPDREVNADVFHVPWTSFSHIFGLVTKCRDPVVEGKFVSMSQLFGFAFESSKCGGYFPEVSILRI